MNFPLVEETLITDPGQSVKRTWKHRHLELGPHEAGLPGGGGLTERGAGAHLSLAKPLAQ